MGFFNFFKRDISEEEFQEQQKVKRGLEKTRTGFFQRIVNTLTNAQIDDDLYDQLEEQLILADVGPACAVRLVDELHDEVEEKHLKTGQEALDALRGIICQELTPRYPMELDGKPAVILVIGVNGVGKTTTIAKLAIPSAPPPVSSWSSGPSAPACRWSRPAWARTRRRSSSTPSRAPTPAATTWSLPTPPDVCTTRRA